MTDETDNQSEDERQVNLREQLNSPGRQIDFYEALAEAQSEMGEGVSVYDVHTRRCLFVNKAVCKIFGYTKEELYELPSVFELIAPEFRASQMAKSALRTSRIDTTEIHEVVGLKKDGTRIDIEYSAQPIEGDETKFVGLVRDVSRRKKAERAVNEVYQIVDNLYNKAPCGYHSVDKDGYFLHINDTLLNWSGYTRAEVFGHRMKIFDMVAPEQRERILKIFQEFLKYKKPAKVEFDMVSKDGTRFPVLIQSTADVDGVGKFLFTRTTTINMTDRKKAEEKARSTEARFQNLINEMPDLGVAILTSEGKITNWNRGAERLTSFSAHDAIGKKLSMLYPEGEQTPDGPEKDLRQAETTGRFEGETWRRRKDGSLFWCHFFLTPIKDSGAEQSFWFVFRDLTEIRRLENSLLEAQCHDLVLKANSVNAFMIISPERKFLFVGPIFEAVTGWVADEWNGRDFSELIHPNDRQFVNQMMSRAFLSKQVPLFTTRIVCKSCRFITIEIGARPVISEGKLVGVAVIARWLRGEKENFQNQSEV